MDYKKRNWTPSQKRNQEVNQKAAVKVDRALSKLNPA